MTELPEPCPCPCCGALPVDWTHTPLSLLASLSQAEAERDAAHNAGRLENEAMLKIYTERAAALAAENARLREALSAIRDGVLALKVPELVDALRADRDHWKAECERLRKLARDVLRNDGGKGSEGYHAVKLFDAREDLRALIDGQVV